MPSTYKTRLDKCRQEMDALGISCVIVTPGASMQYLSGFSEEAHERLLCLVLPSDQSPFFIVPALNAEQASRNAAGIDDIRSWTDTQGYDSLLADAARNTQNSGKLAVDDPMPARFLLKLIEIVSPNTLISAGQLFDTLRSVKDDAELDALRRAAQLTDQAFLAALKECKPGVTESQLADVIRNFVSKSGAELSFDTILAAGPNSALPHHHTGNKVIKEGDIVLFDLGAKVDGYCGDITRVVCVGEPSEKQQYIYKIVYAAHMAALLKAGPNIPAQHVDAAARFKIEDYGFGDEFVHRTGHGIGLEPHESPNIVQGNLNKLVQGNCFSIEPGIYLNGEFGVRLENIVTISDTGCESFNASISPTLLDVDALLKFYGV